MSSEVEMLFFNERKLCTQLDNIIFLKKRFGNFFVSIFRKRFGEQPDGQPEQRRGQPSRYHTQVLLLSNTIK